MLHYTLAVSLNVVLCLPTVISRSLDARSTGCDSAESRSCTACVWLSPKSSRQKNHYDTQMVFPASKSRISVNSTTSDLGGVRTSSGRARERTLTQSPISFDWLSPSGRIGLIAGTREQGSQHREDAHLPIDTRPPWNRHRCLLTTTTRAASKQLAYTQPGVSAVSACLARTCHCTPRRSCVPRHKSRFLTPLLDDHHPPSGSYLNLERSFDKTLSRITRQYRPLRACRLNLATDPLGLATSRERSK